MREVADIIAGRECHIFSLERSECLLIQPVDEHDAALLQQEVEIIGEQTHKPFSLAAFKIIDWNEELTPWTAPPVFGKTPFGNGAKQTLAYVIDRLIPNLQSRGVDAPKKIIGGYSLAGLFALWASYQTAIFDGVVAASPSVWYPDWIDYVANAKPFAGTVYLSLGDKEHRAKHPVMSKVETAIRRQYELLMGQGINTVLDWNSGNHFVDTEKRMAKGFAYILG